MLDVLPALSGPDRLALLIILERGIITPMVLRPELPLPLAS